MAFFFSSEGPAEEGRAAEELADAPEAIEKPCVLWHVARCTGAEDFVGAAETLSKEEEQTEELVVRALKMLAVRALLRSLAVRALKENHWTSGQASLA